MARGRRKYIAHVSRCPFCGSDKIDIITDDNAGRHERSYVKCANCGSSSGRREDIFEAILLWNSTYETFYHLPYMNLRHLEQRYVTYELEYTGKWYSYTNAGEEVTSITWYKHLLEENLKQWSRMFNSGRTDDRMCALLRTKARKPIREAWKDLHHADCDPLYVDEKSRRHEDCYEQEDVFK